MNRINGTHTAASSNMSMMHKCLQQQLCLSTKHAFPVSQVEFDDGVGKAHSYAAKVTSEGVAPRSRQARIGKELAGLAASLPITLSSSVFVRVDQSHMTLWKALITCGHVADMLDDQQPAGLQT